MRRLVVLLLLPAVLALVAASGAAGSPRSDIAAKRRQAQAALASANALGMRLESAVNRYDTARATLAVVRASIRENERAIGVVQHNFTVGQSELARELVLGYRQPGTDAAALLLTASSIDDVISRLEILHRSTSRLSILVRDLATARRDLAHRRDVLARERSSAAALVRRADSERRVIAAGIAEQRRIVRGLEGEIAQIQRVEAARQARIAAEARRRLAAAQTAAAEHAASHPDPGIGGSGTSGGGGGGGPIVAPPNDGSIGARVVTAAMRWLGTPYSWGGGDASGPTRGIDRGANTVGFDCSGLTLYAYAQVGIRLAHYTGDQYNAGTRISRIGQLAIGDLVFFGSDLGHEGIYIGAGQFIHAPHTGAVVEISSLSGYYADQFQGGVRPY